MQNLNRGGAFIQITIIIGLMVLVVSIYLLFFSQANDFSIRIEKNKHIASKIGGNFVLTDKNGNVFDSDQLKGSISLVYFGYTRAPHNGSTAPDGSTAPEKLVEIKKRMDENHIPVQIVFITLDPEYDTPKILKKYLLQFDPTFIGLTGTIQQIEQVADKYKVYYHKQANKDYIKHSAFLYLMKINGSFLHYFCVTPNCWNAS